MPGCPVDYRTVQNTVLLDTCYTMLPRALRALGYDPALVSYTTAAPDPCYHRRFNA